jgi:hypothetical protein
VWKKSLIMLSMYLIGIVAAFLMAWLFKRTLLRSETPILLMEMPPYRAPSLTGIILRMRERAWLFLKRAGTVILALSVVLWSLMTYPKPSNPDATRSEQLSHSVAGRLGHAWEPVIAPLGFDWKIGIGLIGGRDGGVEPAQNPAVEFFSLAYRQAGFAAVETVDVRVARKKAVHVFHRAEELVARLEQTAHRELHVVPGRGVTHHVPTDNVGTVLGWVGAAG